MKHIRKFETTAGFEAERYTSAVPNVSLITQTNTINYLPEPEWVEIADVKWATKNLGAATMFDIGLYYQCGDTQGYTVDQVGDGEGQKKFSQNDYKYYDANTGDYTKYYSDGKTTLDPEDDAVTTNWGSNWRMPTLEDVQNLIGACTVEYTSYQLGEQGPIVSGYIFTDNTDSSKTLFFPDSNSIHATNINPSNLLLTNTLVEGGSDCGDVISPQVKTLFIQEGGGYYFGMELYCGCVIRPVRTV